MARPVSALISSLMTIATVGCTIVIVLHPTANAQSPDPQQQCSTEAKRVFEDLRRTYDAEVRGLQLKSTSGWAPIGIITIRRWSDAYCWSTKTPLWWTISPTLPTWSTPIDACMLFTWKRTVRCNPAPLYKAYDKRRLAKAAMNLMRLFRSTWKSKNNDRQGLWRAQIL